MNSRTKLMIVGVGIGALLGGIWAYRDYRSWLALGPGGLPYNLYGWLRVTWLRLRKRNPTDTLIFEPWIGRAGDRRVLDALPIRAGNRPHVAPHPIPHRQLDQRQRPRAARAQQIFHQHVVTNPYVLSYRTSHVERCNTAIFLRQLALAPRHAQDTYGEIGHIHPSDGSMHMILSPSDAKTVSDAGWGERHPLAGVYAGLPETYLMIYAPRTPEENVMIARILEAAVAYAAGTPTR